MAQSQTSANSGGTSSRNRHGREHDVGSSSSTASPRYAGGDSEWETKEVIDSLQLDSHLNSFLFRFIDSSQSLRATRLVFNYTFVLRFLCGV